MTFRPGNWVVWKIHETIYSIENESEKMEIWLANGRWGIHFKVNGRRYDTVALLAISPWRYMIYKKGMKLANSEWINEA